MKRLVFPLSLLLLGPLGACVGPARTDRLYEGKAVETAKTIRSAVETARLAATAAGRGKATGQYESVVLGDAENDAGAAMGAFDSIQPPGPRSDALHHRLSPLFQSATDILRQLRIAARRSELSKLPAIARGLAPVSLELAGFVDAHG
jgi:hypothetical protein